MGFGHRVYKVRDLRTEVLSRAVTPEPGKQRRGFTYASQERGAGGGPSSR